MTASAAVDLELKKHFEELQTQMAETRTKMRQMDAQMDGLRIAGKRAAMTKKQVTQLTPETRTYESLGRMFVLRSRDEVNKMLDEKVKMSEEKVTGLEANQKYLENSLKERENNLREMIIQKQMKNMSAGSSE